jgi:hypothetical protein
LFAYANAMAVALTVGVRSRRVASGAADGMATNGTNVSRQDPTHSSFRITPSRDGGDVTLASGFSATGQLPIGDCRLAIELTIED